MSDVDIPLGGPDELEAAPWSDEEPPDDVELYGEPIPIATPLPRVWPEPEDRGTATLSDLGEVEYVEDLIRPGRITLVGAEEGSGKSYAITGELAIRVAVAGGSFAGTWPVLRTGPVLVLSEMHADDDFAREATILSSIELDRPALTNGYYRLSLMTAAGGPPALTVHSWRAWVTGWLRDHEAILLVVDTATGATQVDPWGKAIQGVYADLRMMLADYPELAIVLIVHLKKPQGRGDRRLSDILGEWGRWNDITLMLEADGKGRSKVSTFKRIRHPRRVAVTRAGGLLVDPIDLDEEKGTKVPLDDVIAAIAARPGLSYAELGVALGVSKDTASNYVKAAGPRLTAAPTGPRRQIRVYPTAEPPNTAEQAQIGGRSAVKPPEPETTAEPPNPMYRFGGRSSVVVEDEGQVPVWDHATEPIEPDEPDVDEGYGPGATDLDPEPVDIVDPVEEPPESPEYVL